MDPTLNLTVSSDSRDVFGRSWLGRRVTVVGLGRSGLAAAELLCCLGAKVRVTDGMDGIWLKRQQAVLYAQGVVQVELGGHSRAMIEGAECVVLSPGISEQALPVQWARQAGIPTLSEIELGFLFCKASIVAVTGTNGKSSTVTLIGDLLRASGRHVVACGNLGTPFTSVLNQLTEASVAVVELSSFQLIHCEYFRPDVAVLLNLGINHLDRHRDLEEYHQAKLRMLRNQDEQHWMVLNALDARICSASDGFRARCVWFGQNRGNVNGFGLADQTLKKLPLYAQVALQVARIYKIPDPLSWQVIRNFRGLEHRLEPVATIRGRKFINDSKSTTPESLLYALEQTRGPVVPIIGGREKGLDMSIAVDALNSERIQGIILMGESYQTLHALFRDAGIDAAKMKHCDNLNEAVDRAWAISDSGTTILLSPAHASFDMFRSFEERGRAFKQAVQALQYRVGSIRA